MNKQVGKVIVKVWVAAGIAVVAATAGANPLSTPTTLSGSTVGTIVPAERAMAVQPAAPDVKFEPTTSSQATTSTQSWSQATPDGTNQAADAASNQAATLGPSRCSSCLSTATQAVTQAANQAANQAATLGPVCGTCGRAAPPQAATQAANQSANQAATLGPHGPSW